MARIVTSGFELNDTLGTATSPDGQAGNTQTVVASPVRSGAFSGAFKRLSSISFPSFCIFNITAPALGTTLYLREYFYVPSSPGLPAGPVALLSPGNGNSAVRLETDGTLTLWALIGGTTWTQQGSASAAITLDTWHRVEMSMLINTGTVDAVAGRLNGTSFASATGLDIADSWTGTCQVGASGSSSYAGLSGVDPGVGFVVYADDVAVNDSTGAAQNSWPGDSKIVLLRPTADSAVGTGWTLGNTTATGGNAWQREDNIPPDSATDLTTTADATQIRNATSNANVNYDATMATYTVAGVTGTVNVLVPLVATGAPVVTSAKAGTVGVVSNPTITNVSLGAGGTSGAFWSGVAMGTYPTGNKWSFGTTTYAPTVTLGTAPVMRVTQVTSSTRIAIVTEMGIYVDYTPVVVIPPTPLVHQSVPFYPRPSRPA